MSDGKHQVRLVPSTVARLLTLAALLLIFMSLFTQIFRFVSGHDTFYGLIPLFNVDREQSIPTFFSVTLLLVASILAAIIAVSKRRPVPTPYGRHWLLLAAIFFFFAMDEGASIHEWFSRPVRSLLNTDGIFYFAWVIPGFVAVLVVAAAYLSFLLHLPRRTRLLVFLSAGLFVGGAIGINLIGSLLWSMDLASSFLYSVTTTVEESFEMAGVILLIYTLLDYLEKTDITLQIQFGRRDRSLDSSSEEDRSQRTRPSVSYVVKER